MFEGTFASDNSPSFNSSNLDKLFSLLKIDDALGVLLSNEILILDPVFVNLILLEVKKSVILSESEADSESNVNDFASFISDFLCKL
jgi:hypothetical protein